MAIQTIRAIWESLLSAVGIRRAGFWPMEPFLKRGDRSPGPAPGRPPPANEPSGPPPHPKASAAYSPERVERLRRMLRLHVERTSGQPSPIGGTP